MDTPFYAPENPQWFTFLGTYEIPQGIPFAGRYDLYWCPQISIPTVIARFGWDGPEYLSGMPTDSIFYEKHPTFPTHEAYRRAKARGLPVGEMKPSGDTVLILADEGNADGKY